MLQRLTEDLEYHDLLDKAVHCSSSMEQMCLVAAFSVSSYSTTVHRIAKPFNPMLGETFELDRLEEMGLRSLCEQVRSPHFPARAGGQSKIKWPAASDFEGAQAQRTVEWGPVRCAQKEQEI